LAPTGPRANRTTSWRYDDQAESNKPIKAAARPAAKWAERRNGAQIEKPQDCQARALAGGNPQIAK